MPAKSNKTNWILAGILFLCLLVYLPTFNNGFTNWDDQKQVLQNLDIQALNISNTTKIFSSFYVGMYQPVTTQAYAIIYSIFGSSATAFHSFSLLIHLLNIILVFVLIRNFCRKDDIALISAALFALSPLQVESVAWVSALSNLLYTAFYLAALIAYLKYIRQHRMSYFFYALTFFIFSLLSKPSAVTFPVLILFIDLYFRRRLNLGLVLEKLPFFLLSLIIGIVIIYARQEAGHIIDISERFGWGSRMLLISYALAFYVARLFVPGGLSAFHPYPVDGLPPEYYIAPIVPLMLLFLVFRLRGELRRQVIVGLMFFLITIAVMMEIIPVGVQVVKERYVYLPSAGIYYIFTVLMMYFVSGRKYSRVITYSILFLLFVSFSVLSFSRAGIWHDSFSLWDDVLEQYPEASSALINRGNAWQDEEEYNRALADYNLAIRWEPYAADAFLNRGLTYYRMNNNAMAIIDFDQAIALGIRDAETFNNRGLLKASSEDISGALADFKMAAEIDPDFIDAWINAGLMQANLTHYNEAFNDFSTAIKKDPFSARAYYWRGMVQLSMQRIEGGCRDMKSAVAHGWPQQQVPKVCQ